MATCTLVAPARHCENQSLAAGPNRHLMGQMIPLKTSLRKALAFAAGLGLSMLSSPLHAAPVVLLSRRREAIAVIVLGLAAILAGALPGLGWPPATASVLRRGADMLIFSALTWGVAHAVYAPGRITSHRLQGAAMPYLSLATIFASAFGLIWELNPAGFAGPLALTRGPGENATMMYFSLTTLTTTGYGDITPVDPFARSLANLEAVLGQFFLAITVARLVMLELQDRRRRPRP
jgi:hypothetical protein